MANWAAAPPKYSPMAAASITDLLAAPPRQLPYQNTHLWLTGQLPHLNTHLWQLPPLLTYPAVPPPRQLPSSATNTWCLYSQRLSATWQMFPPPAASHCNYQPSGCAEKLARWLYSRRLSATQQVFAPPTAIINLVAVQKKVR